MHRLPNLLDIPARFLVISMTLLLIQSTPGVAWSAEVKQTSIAEVGTTSCPDGDCSVQIGFSGKLETWVAPPNSGNYRIEIAGASGGGDRGGTGALIRANLKLEPGEVLEFVIGGAGKRGGSSSGGFNGGGRAGAGASAAASGGGMSQLFLPSASTRPILIAGGGGGAGGGDRSAGGAAGLLGSPGVSSKNSTGGGGGDSSRGGQAGGSTWVFEEATAGEAGQGGTGATVLTGSPGGGGGGGYFGGGGGGAAYQDCCHPGSGGGGGSSFADPSYFSAVEMLPAPIGSGFAIIHYQLLPTVAAHQWKQFDASSGDLRIEFTAGLVTVRLDRVSVSGCERVSAMPAGTVPAKTWNFKLQSCAEPNLLFMLHPGALESQSSSGNPILGPASEQKFSLKFANTSPALKFQSPNLFTTQSATLLLLAERQLSGLMSSDLRASGCDLSGIQAADTGFEIKLRNCTDGSHSLRLLAASVRDSFGNQLPTSDLVQRFRVDLFPPKASLKLLEMVESSGTATAELTFSEPVTSPLGQLERQLAQAGCESDWNRLSDLRFVGTLRCDSPITLSIPPGSLSDAAGRTGPVSAVNLEIDFSQTSSSVPDTESLIPPWIPVGESSTSAPENLADASALASAQEANGEASGWIGSDPMILRYFGIGVLILLALILVIGALRMARRRRNSGASASGKNDGALAVDKYPVFGKPAHRLG
jgi:hypothetical protein